MPTPSRIATFRRHLLGWYTLNARDLPWRSKGGRGIADPYTIWISEIMLQQTQVDRVIPFFEAWMKRFPDVESLAKARWGSVLAVWRGLGYYSRAKNAMATAREIVNRYDGEFPKDTVALRSFPGIGRYTAGAITSFAFGVRSPIVDTNVKKLLSRVFGDSPDARETEPDEVWWSLAAKLVPRKDPGTFNQAMMEVGALVCTARSPDCPNCPFGRTCRAKSNGWLEKPPAIQKARRGPRKKSSVPTIRVTAAVIHKEGLYLITKRARTAKHLPGYWEFPGGKIEPGESERHCMKREIMEELGVEVSVRPPFFRTEHEYDERVVKLSFHRCQILRGTPKPEVGVAMRWVRPDELAGLKFPPADDEVIEILARGRNRKKR